ncbi:uncharacterized protein KQ657_001993 [Scheffersomyces spartinae]|uniref:Uncharacterized protein n=1 Tax=Scheffersomyces spartinae TaxID=45513 RepID=A0A9P7V6P1_9ASCO|nr:uncharacterized protein KQ657_001993 [Scheffersomyces spartinae]KAG7192274.1 hypothetical protein KQ657_001993 [Scheffersomyces spartinae]
MSEIDEKLNARLARIEELRRKRRQNKGEDDSNDDSRAVPQVELPTIAKEGLVETEITGTVEKPEPITIGPNETVEAVALRIQQQELQRIESLASESMNEVVHKSDNKHNEDMKRDIEGYLRLAKLRTNQALAETLRYVESTKQ